MLERSARIEQQRPPASGELPLPVQLQPTRITPVYGTAQPSRGLPRRLRKLAYTRPTHDPIHWLLLLIADRVESGANPVHEAATPGKRGLVLRHFSRQARAHPEGLATAVAILFFGCFLWQRMRARSGVFGHG